MSRYRRYRPDPGRPGRRYPPRHGDQWAVPDSPDWPYTRRREPAAVTLARLGWRAGAGYAKWVARSPETRGLGTLLAGLYPAGEIAHLAGADPLALASFAPPAALAAYAGTWKKHRSRRYSATTAALAAGVPGWLAVAAATGVASLPELAAYTAVAAGGWSAITWSEVLRQRRAWQAEQARWQTLALAAGLDGSRLTAADDTRTGQRYRVDIRATGKTATALARGELGERLAAQLGTGAERVRLAADRKHAGVLVVTVQHTDPWAASVPHPALAAGYAPPARSVMAGPLLVGEDPDNGAPLAVTVYDSGGAWHTFIAAATGGGKTTLYSNLAEQATARDDVLVWAIDLRKGTIPYFWRPALDAAAGLAPDGTPEYAQALAILAWGSQIVRLRSAASGGVNHVPSAADPAVLILIDEGDTLVGDGSPIAQQAKPLLHDIFRGGRSAGVGVTFAGQRGVMQYTGSKDPHANAGNKIVLRVNRAAEMNNIVPDWMADNMPDMHAYAPGVPGVALVVDPRNAWRAGRVADLSDLPACGKIAAARGAPAAALPPAIADRLHGYASRRQPATASGTDISPLPGRPPAEASPAAQAGRRSDAVVAYLADRLPAEVAARLGGLPHPPAAPAGLADLVAARAAIDAAEHNPAGVNRAIPVPATISAPVLRLLAQRGHAGARRDEIITALGKPESSVKRWLAIMRDHGLITTSGATSAARYHLPGHAPEAEPGRTDGDAA